MKRYLNIGNQQISLTNKECLFVEYYLGKAKFNATDAAKFAGYSERSAYQQGYENLKKPDIKKYIQYKSRPILEDMGISQKMALRELATIAFGNVFDYLDKDFEIKDLDSIEQKKSGAIKSLHVTDTGFSINLFDKVTALKIILGLLESENNKSLVQ